MRTTRSELRMGITKSRAGHYTVSIYAGTERGARRLHSCALHSSLVSARWHGREILEILKREQIEGTGLFAALSKEGT